MDLYDGLYLACLLGTVLSGAASVFLFVRLDIRTAWRVLGKGERQKRIKSKRTKAGKSGERKQMLKAHAGKEEQKTALLRMERKDFHVIKEILLVHTDEIL